MDQGVSKVVLYGHVRDFFPRVTLSLPQRDGGPLVVEFIVDTAFDGALTLPSALLERLDVAPATDRRLVRLADGTRGRAIAYEISLTWTGEPQLVEVLELENNPLLGIELLSENLVQIEMTDGGTVEISPL